MAPESDELIQKKTLREWRAASAASCWPEYIHSGNIAIKACGELNRLAFKSPAHNDKITSEPRGWQE